MRSIRIYQNSAFTTDAKLELSPQGAHHVRTVLRLKPGQDIFLFNGRDQVVAAKLLEVSKKRVLVLLGAVEVCSLESPLILHLAQALIKGERMEWLIQKSVELGVHSITPLMTQRTVVNLSKERLQKKIQQWQAIAISACEQCGRNRIPYIADAVSLSDFLQDLDANQQRFILNPRAKQTFADINLFAEPITVLIGPEGGFSDDEISMTLSHHVQGVRMGPRILRAETAAIVAQTLLQGRYGDL